MPTTSRSNTARLRRRPATRRVVLAVVAMALVSALLVGPVPQASADPGPQERVVLGHMVVDGSYLWGTEPLWGTPLQVGRFTAQPNGEGIVRIEYEHIAPEEPNRICDRNPPYYVQLGFRSIEFTAPGALLAYGGSQELRDLSLGNNHDHMFRLHSAEGSPYSVPRERFHNGERYWFDVATTMADVIYDSNTRFSGSWGGIGSGGLGFVDSGNGCWDDTYYRLAYWSPGVEHDAPEASCKVDAAPNEPGHFRFDATDSTGVTLRYDWDFGDGNTGTGFLEQHTYSEPGNYMATLVVTDSEDRTDTATCEVEVAAPELGVALSFPDRASLPDGSPNMMFGVDDEVTVRVHLAATEGVGDLSEVEFVDDMLRSAPTTAWDIHLDGQPGEEGDPGEDPGEDPGDDEEGPLTLEPGEEVTFDVAATALEPGAFDFLSTAVAVDAVGRTVGPVELSRGGRIGELEVEVVVDPSVIELEEGEDEDGPVPEPVTVTVKVTNPFEETVRNVVLEANDPQLVSRTTPPLGYRAFNYLGPDPEDPDGPLVEVKPEPAELGDLEPGETVEHEFEGLAVNRGDVELRVLARGSIGMRLIAGAGTGELQVATDVLFAFDAEIDPSSHWMQGGEPWVDGGAEWAIEGTFENRTHDETFEVVVLPIRQYNAGYGIPLLPLEGAIDPECAVGASRQLEPGEIMEWSAPVHTSASGGTRSQIGYAPLVYVIEEDGTRVPLDEDHILVTAGSDEHLVRVDTRDLPPEVPGATELMWTFTESAAQELHDSFIGLLAFGAEVLELGLQPWEWPEAYRAGSDRLVEFFVTVYDNLTPAEQDAWNASVVAGLVLATGMAVEEATQMVDAHVAESFTELQVAWSDGDWHTTAAWFGRQVGASPDVLLGSAIKTFGLCKLVSQRTPWARNALAAKEARIADELAALGENVNATNFPTGAKINRHHRRTIWGIDDAMFRNVQDFVDEFQLSIGVRRRGPGSIDKIEAGTHNPKSFNNKAKNASATDRDWLGFVDDLDTSVIKQPPPYSEMITRLADASPDLRAQVLARHRTRLKEWYGKGPEPGSPGFAQWLEDGTGANFTTSERYKWGRYSIPVEQGGGIPVPKKGAPLDYRDNVSKGRSLPPDDVLYERAPARVRTVEAPDGRPQMILETDRGGGFKPDTGDMDPLVVTKADLELLPEAKRIKFYERAHELGFEHVESASWNHPAGRNAYLIEHAIAGPGRPQGESMFQWMPNGEPRATRFDPQRSWHDPSDELNVGRLFLHGTDVYLKTTAPAPDSSYVIDDDGHTVHLDPKSSWLLHPDCASDASEAEAQTCQVLFDRGPDAKVMRGGDGGSNQSWSEEDGWQDHEMDEPGDLLVLPQSVLTDDAGAGEDRIEIADASDLDLVPGLDSWFAVGDEVILDPGGPNEERAVIGGFGSLLFEQPLANAHPAGTLVSVVSALGDPNDPRDPNGPWALDAPDSPDSPDTPDSPDSPGATGPPVGPTRPGDPGGVGGSGGPDGPVAAPVSDGVAQRSAGGPGSAAVSSDRTDSTLPVTGGDVGPVVLVGFGALVLGAVLQLRPRWRRAGSGEAASC